VSQNASPRPASLSLRASPRHAPAQLVFQLYGATEVTPQCTVWPGSLDIDPFVSAPPVGGRETQHPAVKQALP
jgi:hypothetical protein